VAIASARLVLLTFPQRWNGTALTVRFLALPKGDPLAPLMAGPETFADVQPAFSAFVIPGLDHLPERPLAQSLGLLVLATPPQRAALFQALAQSLPLDPAPPPVTPLANPQIKKHLVPSYRNAFAFSGPRHRNAFAGDEYVCFLEDSATAASDPTPVPTTVTWAQIIGYALRQPELARQLGLRYEVSITPPAGSLAEGGWLYVDLHPQSAFAANVAAQPDRLAVFAARIPPLSGQPRTLFAAAIFPVSSTPAPAGAFDPIFPEVEAYDDGFCKIVHGAQAGAPDGFDILPRGIPAPKDSGIRLGWDDEQVVIWLNRQLAGDPADPVGSTSVAPLGVAGYRVDVRPLGSAGPWTSLVRVAGNLEAGGVPLGFVSQERWIETLGLRHTGQQPGEFWLPSYFTTWSGGSLVAADRIRIDMAGEPHPPRMLNPVDDQIVELRYGEQYEFRVRAVDLTGGGPLITDDRLNPAPAPTARVHFKRFSPPRQPRVMRIGDDEPGQAPHTLRVQRPLLGFPDAVFAAGPMARPALIADVPKAALEDREPGIVDTDVEAVHITVELKLPSGSPDVRDAQGGYLPIFTTSRLLPTSPGDDLDIPLVYIDVPNALALRAANPLQAIPGTGALHLPTARDVRLSIRCVCRPDPGLDYFGSPEARVSAQAVRLDIHAAAADERLLLRPEIPARQIRAMLLQPEPPASGNQAAQAALGGNRTLEPGIAQRIATELGLRVQGLTFAGAPNHRTIFGCSAALRHTLSPDGSLITFASQADLTERWIVVVTVTLIRDWSWRGHAAANSFALLRDGRLVATSTVADSVSGVRSLDHAGETDLVFFDAIDPKPHAGNFPDELQSTYALRPAFAPPSVLRDPDSVWTLRLPVAAPPAQTPRLAGAGLAFSGYAASPDYASTEERRRALWLEFAEPPRDPRDRYFARILAYGPDPMLLREADALPEPPEPVLPITPESIRVITPGQPADDAGLDAMQPLVASSTSPTHFVLPLPPNLGPESLELFGFFTYEFRVGHDGQRWSTARARFGPPLRATGIQHPPPALEVQVARNEARILVGAPFATPVLGDRILLPNHPCTDLWALLYTQVRQVDGQAWRNILLARTRLEARPAPRDQPHSEDVVHFGVGFFAQPDVEVALDLLGLVRDARLSLIVAETLTPDPRSHRGPDPLGTHLGHHRILRVSRLTPVPPVC